MINKMNDLRYEKRSVIPVTTGRN